MIIVVFGVTGVGKTTIASRLAARLGWRFLDADDFHDEAAWRKLERGEALTDADRWPWLARVREAVERVAAAGESAVLACSALRQAYRDALLPQGVHAADMRFVHLDASTEVVAERLTERVGHRASATLLPSQFDTLEPAADALRVNAAEPPDEIVERIIGTWADDIGRTHEL